MEYHNTIPSDYHMMLLASALVDKN